MYQLESSEFRIALQCLKFVTSHSSGCALLAASRLRDLRTALPAIHWIAVGLVVAVVALARTSSSSLLCRLIVIVFTFEELVFFFYLAAQDTHFRLLVKFIFFLIIIYIWQQQSALTCVAAWVRRPLVPVYNRVCVCVVRLTVCAINNTKLDFTITY